MDRTRDSLRRVRLYILVLIACGFYAAMPRPERDEAVMRAREAAHGAARWAVEAIEKAREGKTK